LAQKEQQQKLFSNAAKIRDLEPYSLVEMNNALKENTYLSAIGESAARMRSWSMGENHLLKATIMR
jgi:hypothetical protein